MPVGDQDSVSPAKSPTSIRSFQRKMELASLRSSRSCQKEGSKVLQEGGPLPAAKRELLSNPQKRIIQGDTRADKARDVVGMGHPGGEQ